MTETSSPSSAGESTKTKLSRARRCYLPYFAIVATSFYFLIQNIDNTKHSAKFSPATTRRPVPSDVLKLKQQLRPKRVVYGRSDNAIDDLRSKIRKKTLNKQKDDEKDCVDRFNATCIVSNNDLVYHFGYDFAPIVLEKPKLVFFTIPKVGCTVFKQLFRRIEGHKDWYIHKRGSLPHNPNLNGLTYLSHYSRADASSIIKDPAWTKAIFLRNPHDRVLSAYLDKGKGTYVRNHCRRACHSKATDSVEYCQDRAGLSFDAFLNVTRVCRDPHWAPQWFRMEKKYWPYIDFMGRFEEIHNDTKSLLELVGLWDEYGASGWGIDRNESIFGSSLTMHATNAHSLFQQYYTTKIASKVYTLYSMDYDNDAFPHMFVEEQVQ